MSTWSVLSVFFTESVMAWPSESTRCACAFLFMLSMPRAFRRGVMSCWLFMNDTNMFSLGSSSA